MGKSQNDLRLQQSPEALCEAIDRAEARAEELARAYAALLNDRKNFQTRLQREQERAIHTAQGRVARDLIDLSDELERALGAARGDEGPLAQGVRLIHAELQKRLQAIGARRLEMVGTHFDPNLAEAVDVLPVEKPEDDEKVLEEVRPGFMLGDQVIRAARVKVGRCIAPVQAVSEPPAQEDAPSSVETQRPEARSDVAARPRDALEEVSMSTPSDAAPDTTSCDPGVVAVPDVPTSARPPAMAQPSPTDQP